MRLTNYFLIELDSEYFDYKYESLFYTHIARNEHNFIKHIFNKTHGVFDEIGIGVFLVTLLVGKYKYITFDASVDEIIEVNTSRKDYYFFKKNDRFMIFEKTTDPLYIISILEKFLRIFDDIEFDEEFYNKNELLIRQKSHLLELIYTTNKHK